MAASACVNQQPLPAGMKALNIQLRVLHKAWAFHAQLLTARRAAPETVCGPAPSGAARRPVGAPHGRRAAGSAAAAYGHLAIIAMPSVRSRPLWRETHPRASQPCQPRVSTRSTPHQTRTCCPAPPPRPPHQLALQVSVQVHSQCTHEQQQGHQAPRLALPHRGATRGGRLAHTRQLLRAPAQAGFVGWSGEGEWGAGRWEQQGMVQGWLSSLSHHCAAGSLPPHTTVRPPPHRHHPPPCPTSAPRWPRHQTAQPAGWR